MAAALREGRTDPWPGEMPGFIIWGSAADRQVRPDLAAIVDAGCSRSRACGVVKVREAK